VAGLEVLPDRRVAGRLLADRLRWEERASAPPVVLALPRGGVPVAAPVAAALGTRLEVLVVRKLGAPGRPELGLGALVEGEEPVYDERGLAGLGLTRADLAGVLRVERAELARRVELYRGGRPPPVVAGRHAVLVDDGLATGVTTAAAVRVLRRRGAAAVTLAVPVVSRPGAESLRPEVDSLVSLVEPHPFRAVGRWYDDFRQVTDAEVLAILRGEGEGEGEGEGGGGGSGG